MKSDRKAEVEREGNTGGKELWVGFESRLATLSHGHTVACSSQRPKPVPAITYFKSNFLLLRRHSPASGLLSYDSSFASTFYFAPGKRSCCFYHLCQISCLLNQVIPLCSDQC